MNVVETVKTDTDHYDVQDRAGIHYIACHAVNIDGVWYFRAPGTRRIHNPTIFTMKEDVSLEHAELCRWCNKNPYFWNVLDNVWKGAAAQYGTEYDPDLAARRPHP